MRNESVLLKLYNDRFGRAADSIVRLPGAGSDRLYYRLNSSLGSCIGVRSDSEKDSRAFLSLASYFRKEGMNVPEILARDDSGRYYLQEDLGPLSLFDLIVSRGNEEETEKYVVEVMRSLVRLQTLPAEDWKRLVSYGEFSRRQIMWDLNYFKYEYLKPSGVVFDEDLLENDFEAFSQRLSGLPEYLTGFMYRDCQSRNVMIFDNKPWWIDFQGGRVGPCVYDAVSFLWQARAGFSSDFRQRMLEIYLSEFAENRGVNVSDIKPFIDDFVLFRTIQVLGAYGFQGIVRRKAHFIESIPGALRNLSDLLSKGVMHAYPELERICRLLIADERFKKKNSETLRIRVFSFSYKKGYPEDYSGNGGGFMFDCRGMHNPGRYDQYKPLTGRDPEVVAFLEERGEVQDFVKNCLEIVSPTVRRYLARGFSGLQIGFGCTGGRHRSVYCAEHLAQAIAEQYPAAEVELIHREQGWRELYNVKEEK